MGIRFEPPEIRVERLGESVRIIKRLLSGETVKFSGTHFQVYDHRIEPRSLQRPRPPLAMGGNGRPMLSLAAKEADIISFLGLGVNRSGRSLRFTDFTPDKLEKKIQMVREVAGDRFDQIELAAFIWYFQEGPNEQVAAKKVQRDGSLSIRDVISSPFTLLGTPDEMVEKLERNREKFGINYWVVKSPSMEAVKDIVAQLHNK
jgi:probable F420-dependent oxidoreductase